MHLMPISAALIVKDEESNLAQCLEALRHAVDEIVVVDTGSRDRTAEIAKGFTLNVHHFPWCHDFAAARNAAVRRATHEWILSIDADEVVQQPEVARARLDDFIARHPQKTIGNVRIVSRAPHGGDWQETHDDIARLFHRQHYKFEGRIHEQLVPLREREAMGHTGLIFIHSGYMHSVVDEKHKSHRNIHLLKQALAETPNDPYLWYQLGRAHFALEEWEAAVEALQLTTPENCGLKASLREEAAILLAYSLCNAGASADAQKVLSGCGGHHSDFDFAKGYVALLALDLSAASSHFTRALELGPGRERVAGTGSYAAAYHLGLVAEAEGDVPRAMAHYVFALQQKHDYRPVIDRSIECMAEHRAMLPQVYFQTVDHESLRARLLAKIAQYLENGNIAAVQFLLQVSEAVDARLVHEIRDLLQQYDAKGKNR